MNLQGGLPFDTELVTDPLREQSSFRPIRTRAKRVRDISRQVNNRLRDEAKADKAAGRETKPQQVHRCLMAYPGEEMDEPEGLSPMSEWCEPCRKRQAAHVALRVASKLRGAAMRSLQKLAGAR